MLDPVGQAEPRVHAVLHTDTRGAGKFGSANAPTGTAMCSALASSRQLSRSAGRRRRALLALVGDPHVLACIALNPHLLPGPACLHPEHAPCALLAGEAVADRDPDRVTLDLDRELPARAGRAPRRHVGRGPRRLSRGRGSVLRCGVQVSHRLSSRSCLVRPKRASLSLRLGFRFRRERRVESPRYVPAERPSERCPLAYALRWAATPATGGIVETGSEAPCHVAAKSRRFRISGHWSREDFSSRGQSPPGERAGRTGRGPRSPTDRQDQVRRVRVFVRWLHDRDGQRETKAFLERR